MAKRVSCSGRKQQLAGRMVGWWQLMFEASLIRQCNRHVMQTRSVTTDIGAADTVHNFSGNWLEKVASKHLT
jgi:hypothetical protein